MQNQKKRVQRLESRNTETENIDTIERVIVDSREQVHHPERFEKILESEDVTEAGITKRMYSLKRRKNSRP